MYKRYRFPPEINQYAVRLSCNKFDPQLAQRLRRNHGGYGDTFYIDEVFVKIREEQHYSGYNLFNLGRHLVSAKNYRYFRLRAFYVWKKGGGDKEIATKRFCRVRELTC